MSRIKAPSRQADLLVSQLRAVGFSHGDLVPTIDVETTDGEPQSVVVANLRTIVNTVSAAIGSLPAIYCSPSWWSGNINSAAFTLDPLWIANWFVTQPQVPENNWGGTGWQVWQFSDAGSVPGISGNVDLDEGGVRSLPYDGFPDPTALPQAANVAGTPQTVSDQPGDINVLWRGTNEQLWNLSFRNSRWGTASTDISAAGGSAALLASDPSVVSAGPGRIDAFWEGEDHNLWYAGYTGGWFGSGTWSAPVSLGLGPLSSEPRAVSPGPGVIDVIWKGSDSALWVDHYNSGWSGGTPLDSGAVDGNPVVASAGQGSDTVFWRDASGDLWADSGTSFGWSGAKRLTTTVLAADPSASATGTTIDVFWDGAGELWHGALSGGVWSGPVALGTETVTGDPSVVDLAPGSVIVDFSRALGADGVVSLHVCERTGRAGRTRRDRVLGPVVGGLRRRRRHRRHLAVQQRHAVGGAGVSGLLGAGDSGLQPGLSAPAFGAPGRWRSLIDDGQASGVRASDIEEESLGCNLAQRRVKLLIMHILTI